MENDMVTTTKLTASLAIAVGVIATLALGTATPSLAQEQFYEPGNNIYVSPSRPAYTDEYGVQRQGRRATDQNVRARGNRGGTVIKRGAPVDDPPGSDFQTRGNNEDDMGCPC